MRIITLRLITLLGLLATALAVFLSSTWLEHPELVFAQQDVPQVGFPVWPGPMPQVEVPIWPGPEPVPVPWPEPECPQVVEEPGYLEMLWDVVRDAFRFITAPDGNIASGTIALDAIITTDGDTIAIYNPEPLVRVDPGMHLRVAIYAWDEKTEAMVPVKLADDGGLDTKGGQTVYIKWMYEDDPQLVRVRALEQRIKELKAADDALSTDVIRLIGKELRRKDDANKPWWEANDYWEATYSALCAWLLEYQIPPGAGGGSSSWNALRKTCKEAR